MKKTSAVSGFDELSIKERMEILRDFHDLSDKEAKILENLSTLGYEELAAIGENPINNDEYSLRFANYFKINGIDRYIPMTIEEASVIAGACYAAKLCYNSGGVRAHVIKSKKYGKAIGQVQLIHVEDYEKAKKSILKHKKYLFRKAKEGHRHYHEHSKPYDLRIRKFDSELGRMLIVNLYIDPGDAMGAGAANDMAEAIASELTRITGYPYVGRIVSNYAGRLTRAELKVPVKNLARESKDGRKWTREEVRDGILWLSAWAEKDPYRAATNNKGIMNGVDAVSLALKQDWRAIKEANNFFAWRNGKPKPLSKWYAKDNFLIGELEMLIPCGIVDGEIKKYPKAEFLLKRVLKLESADQLAEIMAAVGLVQNLAALSMDATIGVTEGHEPYR